MTKEETTRQYGGKWHLCDETVAYDGELFVNTDKNSIVLNIIIPASREHMIPGISRLGKIPYISGTLFTGGNVLLYNCQTGQIQNNFASYTSQIIYADYIFWGLEINDKKDLVFSGAEIDFGNVISWFDLCEFENLYWTDCNFEYGYHWKKKEPFVLSNKKGLTIQFTPSLDSHGEKYDQEIKLNQKVLVEFNYLKEHSWDKILADVEKVQFLIGLGIGQKIDIESVYYYHKSLNIPNLTNEVPRPIRASVYLGNGTPSTKIEVRRYDYLFELNDIAQLQDGLQKWDSSYKKLKPVLDLIFSIQNNHSETLIFLSLTQAIETFHSRFIVQKLKNYIKLVDEHISVFADEHEKNFWNDFLIDNDQRCQPEKKIITLKNRISDMIFEGGNSIFQRCGFGIPQTKFPEKVSKTRNYYTHYIEDLKQDAYTVEELTIINGYLLCILYYHIMLLIGFPKDFTAERINKRLHNINIYKQIHDIHIC